MTSRLHGAPTKGKVGLSASGCKGSSVELGPVWATPGCVRPGGVQPHIRRSRGKRCLASLHSRRNKSSHRERGGWSPTFVRTPSSSPPLFLPSSSPLPPLIPSPLPPFSPPPPPLLISSSSPTPLSPSSPPPHLFPRLLFPPPLPRLPSFCLPPLLFILSSSSSPPVLSVSPSSSPFPTHLVFLFSPLLVFFPSASSCQPPLLFIFSDGDGHGDDGDVDDDGEGDVGNGGE